ncbi:MAG: pentapeptide repeat-containing protein [Desulfuromonadales bacterium]|nr:MAG: pentapeptide repeat-containing protein [Desulfuromonadales bacterium]
MKHCLPGHRALMFIVAGILVLPGGSGAEVGKRAVAVEDKTVEVRMKPALKYEEYVRLVSRQGVAGPRRGTGRSVKAATKARDTKPAQVRAPETPAVVAAAPAPRPMIQVRSGGWRPSIDEVRDVLRSSRDLSGANLRGMNFAGFDLRGAVLQNADLYLANLEGALLDGANLRGASLEMASLRGARLRGAKLDGAGLFKANLDGADLEGADLTGVYAVGASLRGTILASATLRGSVFTNAVIDSAGPVSPVVVAEGGRRARPDEFRAQEGRILFIKF